MISKCVAKQSWCMRRRMGWTHTHMNILASLGSAVFPHYSFLLFPSLNNFGGWFSHFWLLKVCPLKNFNLILGVHCPFPLSSGEDFLNHACLLLYWHLSRICCTILFVKGNLLSVYPKFILCTIQYLHDTQHELILYTAPPPPLNPSVVASLHFYDKENN